MKPLNYFFGTMVTEVPRVIRVSKVPSKMFEFNAFWSLFLELGYKSSESYGSSESSEFKIFEILVTTFFCNHGSKTVPTLQCIDNQCIVLT